MTHIKFNTFLLISLITLLGCNKKNLLEEINEPITEWNEVSNSLNSRINQTTNVLNNGKILVIGGYYDVANVSLFDPVSLTWETTGSLSIGRSEHQSIKLPDGRVIVMGGNCNCTGTMYTTSCEIYDPATGLWEDASEMNIPRSSFKATLLDNGQILVTGGFNEQLAITSAELYDPISNIWQMAPAPSHSYAVHEAIKLNNGNVLVIGGGEKKSCEIYDPISQNWNIVSSLNEKRAFHKAVLMNDGKVLVTGGNNYQYSTSNNESNTATSEIYDPITDAWMIATPMNSARNGHTMTVLPNGQVLAIGGHGYIQSFEVFYPAAKAEKSCEIYDPETNKWRFVAEMSIARSGHTTNLNNSGQLIVIGGETTQSVEVSRFSE